MTQRQSLPPTDDEARLAGKRLGRARFESNLCFWAMVVLAVAGVSVIDPLPGVARGLLLGAGLVCGRLVLYVLHMADCRAIIAGHLAGRRSP